MLDGDKLVLHSLGFFLSGFQRLVHVSRDIDPVCLPACAGDLGELLHSSFGSSPEAFRLRADGGNELGDQTVCLIQQGKKQMGLLNLRRAVFLADLLGRHQSLLRFSGIVQVTHNETSLSCGASSASFV